MFVRRFREACHAAAWHPLYRPSVSVCTTASQPRITASPGEGLGRGAGHVHALYERTGHLEKERRGRGAAYIIRLGAAGLSPDAPLEDGQPQC